MKELIKRLSIGAPSIVAALANVDDKEAKWKPASDAWSLVEIVNHLADEEVEDFRTRLDLLLHQPEKDWPGIDPEAAAIERKYQDRDLGESLNSFVNAREESLAWLDTLDNHNWDNVSNHPIMGDLRAGDIFTSWVAHDLLHLRQIIKRRFEYTQHLAGDYSTRYAGEW